MLVVLTFITGLFMSFEPITDNDWFWHTVIGKWINVHGTIPRTELFTWFGHNPKLAWFSHEWLSEWIMYKITPIGCIILMLFIFVGLYFVLTKLLRINYKKWLDFKYIYLLLLVVFFKVTGPRPYIVSLLFFAYLIYILFNYLDNTKPIFRKLIWTLPILQILWVNLHGGSSSLPYIFIIGVIISNWFIKILPYKDSRWGGSLLSKEQIKTLLKLLGLILIASLINPHTYQMILYPFTNMANNTMLDVILEWQSPSFHGMLGLYIFVMIAFPLFNMILTKSKYRFYEIAFLLLLLFMCLKSQRFVGMYAIYSTWLVGKYFFLTDEFYDKLREIFKKYATIIKYAVGVGAIVLTVGVIFIQCRGFTKVIDNDGYYSDAAIKKVIELKPERLYNDFGQGGYLLYKLDEYKALDSTPLFIYGLGDVFSENILTDATNLARLKDDPEKILNKYNFDVILTSNTYPLHYYLDQKEDWKLIYNDNMCFIYIRR